MIYEYCDRPRPSLSVLCYHDVRHTDNVEKYYLRKYLIILGLINGVSNCCDYRPTAPNERTSSNQ
jgi:hypothetical protein